MHLPGDGELLALWELGSNRHLIDRALLLGRWARPDLPASQLAKLPVGVLNASLLRLRDACFGSCIDGFVDCPGCDERMEFAVEVADLLARADDGDPWAELEVSGHRFRPPDTRDLASVAHERDLDAAALRLLERCCVHRPEAAGDGIAHLLPEVEAGLEALDPAADIELSLVCPACGHPWTAGLVIGELLWDELDARARLVLAEIHRLARAYGWTEGETLALSPHRRSAYLDMVGT